MNPVTNPNDPAFGHASPFGQFQGLTKREYIAAIMLSGLLSSGAGGHKGDKILAAVTYADELIDELNEAQ